jgi:uncharacterized membrane protein
MDSDDKRQRKKLQRRTPPIAIGPETGPAEPIGSAGPVSRWVREGIVISAAVSAGPLPSAAELEHYREVNPAAPEVILREYQEESAHRRSVEWEIVRGENARANRGQVFGLTVFLTGLLVGGALAFAGHDMAGSIIAGADLVAGAAIFVRGARHAGDPDEVPRPPSFAG